MGWFGGSSLHFQFEMYSTSHVFVMVSFILVSFLTFIFRDRLKELFPTAGELAIAFSLVLIEVTYHVWMMVNGNWDVSHSVQLELCSISLVLTVILLVRKSKVIYELVFFTAVLGCTQSIFFPSLHYDFPHFRFFHFFYTHLMIVWVAFYFTWVKGYRPTFKSTVKLFVFLNVLLPFIILVNRLTGGNYWYLSHKPTHFSLLDFLGPYPWYILSMEALVIVLSLIAWLIFRKKKPQPRHESVEENSSGLFLGK
ncbi:TIGR02206 family membrane protein [Bacillus sp. DNRA2]|nr:TIGR02206 family membrane protein [Bacillus sp. DNRA2]NMD68717.1 TIGR02206 family membrane protein [Bacillus sp. DNRA2]